MTDPMAGPVTGAVPGPVAAEHPQPPLHGEPYDLPGVVQEARPGAVPPPDAGPAAPSPEPLGVAVAATGHAEVDAAIERLADADALPTDAHIEVYEDVHRGLRDALAALDENRG